MTEKEAVEVLIKVCEVMGWGVAVPNGSEDAEVPGLILGTEDYLGQVLSYVPSHTEWSKEK